MHKFLDDAENIVPPLYEMYKLAMININVSGDSLNFPFEDLFYKYSLLILGMLLYLVSPFDLRDCNKEMRFFTIFLCLLSS
jgi:hypothetical protein